MELTAVDKYNASVEKCLELFTKNNDDINKLPEDLYDVINWEAYFNKHILFFNKNTQLNNISEFKIQNFLKYLTSLPAHNKCNYKYTRGEHKGIRCNDVVIDDGSNNDQCHVHNKNNKNINKIKDNTLYFNISNMNKEVLFKLFQEPKLGIKRYFKDPGCFPGSVFLLLLQNDTTELRDIETRNLTSSKTDLERKRNNVLKSKEYLEYQSDDEDDDIFDIVLNLKGILEKLDRNLSQLNNDNIRKNVVKNILNDKCNLLLTHIDSSTVDSLIIKNNTIFFYKDRMINYTTMTLNNESMYLFLSILFEGNVLLTST